MLCRQLKIGALYIELHNQNDSIVYALPRSQNTQEIGCKSNTVSMEIVDVCKWRFSVKNTILLFSACDKPSTMYCYYLHFCHRFIPQCLPYSCLSSLWSTNTHRMSIHLLCCVQSMFHIFCCTASVGDLPELSADPNTLWIPANCFLFDFWW